MTLILEKGKRTNSKVLSTKSGNKKRISYIVFDLSYIKGPISKAELKLKATSNSGKAKIKIYQSDEVKWTQNNLSNSNVPKKRSYLGILNTNYKKGNIYTWKLRNSLKVGKKITIIIEQSTGKDNVNFSSKEGQSKPVLKVYRNVSKSLDINSYSQEVTTTTNNLENIVIFPNPVNSTLYLNKVPEAVSEINIFDINGQRVISKPINDNNSHELNVNSLAKGVYFLKSYTVDKKSKTLKFIKN